MIHDTDESKSARVIGASRTKFMLAATFLSLTEMLCGIVATLGAEAKMWGSWNFILRYIGFGFPVGLSLMMFVGVLYLRRSIVVTEKWLFFRIGVFTCVGLSLLQPSMPLAVVVLYYFIDWTKHQNLETRVPPNVSDDEQ